MPHSAAKFPLDFQLRTPSSNICQTFPLCKMDEESIRADQLAVSQLIVALLKLKDDDTVRERVYRRKGARWVCLRDLRFGVCFLQLSANAEPWNFGPSCREMLRKQGQPCAPWKTSNSFFRALQHPSMQLNPYVRPVAQVKRLSSLLVPDELLAMVIEQAMETDGEL